MAKINTITRDSWRLIHDGTKVIALFHSTGKTQTINQVFSGTKEDCEAEIARLKLEPLPPEQERKK